VDIEDQESRIIVETPRPPKDNFENPEDKLNHPPGHEGGHSRHPWNDEI